MHDNTKRKGDYEIIQNPAYCTANTEQANEYRIAQRAAAFDDNALTALKKIVFLQTQTCIIKRSSFNVNMPESQDFDRFLLLDIEATCIKDMRINPQEVLQLSALLVDATKEELPVIAAFNHIVKPVFRPKLSPFCIKLTGYDG